MFINCGLLSKSVTSHGVSWGQQVTLVALILLLPSHEYVLLTPGPT